MEELTMYFERWGQYGVAALWWACWSLALHLLRPPWVRLAPLWVPLSLQLQALSWALRCYRRCCCRRCCCCCYCCCCCSALEESVRIICMICEQGYHSGPHDAVIEIARTCKQAVLSKR